MIDKCPECGIAFKDHAGLIPTCKALQAARNDAQSAREALADTLKASCAWTYDEESESWDSSCGEKWTFIDGGPKENGVRYCHGFGKPISLAPERG